MKQTPHTTRKYKKNLSVFFQFEKLSFNEFKNIINKIPFSTASTMTSVTSMQNKQNIQFEFVQTFSRYDYNKIKQ